MKGDISRRYSQAKHFFELEGSVVMKLTADAAIDVCNTASRHGLMVVRIEGGFWHDPKFEARLDCIWDGMDPPVTLAQAKKNNQQAADFIRKKSDIHDVFILTAPSIFGYSHRVPKRK